MKAALKKIWLGFGIVLITVSGCDYVSQPIKSSQNNSILPSTPPTYIDSSAVSGPSSYKNYKVLLECLTGHFCVNCPVADSTGDFLINPHQNPAAYANIILVEENVGEFSDPYSTYPSPPPGIKPYAWAANYQSVAGNTWVSLFNPPGYPLGVINRRYDPYPLFCQQDNQWISIIDSDLYTNHISGTINSAQVTIDIHDSCWIPQRLMGAVFKVNVIAALPGTSYLLQTLIIEDSIISGQMDNIVDSQYVTAFLHRNVLRGAMGNNTGGLLWGTPIPASVTGTSGASWSTFQTYDFTKGENGAASGTSTSPPWNMAHCYIVAFVYSASTNTETPYEVIQAEMIKIE